VSFEIIIPAHIQKYIRNLEKDEKRRLLQKIFDLKEDPFRFVQRLVDSPFYKLRVGRFRVIIEIDIIKQRISIVRIGDRSKVYF